MLTTIENRVLKCFEEAAKSGTTEPLAYVLEQLKPDDLNALLKAHDGILKYLEETAKNKNLQYLVWVLSKFNFADLNTLFETSANGVLEHLRKTSTFVLVLVEFSDDKYIELNPDDLNTLLTKLQMES
jgi:hypothetical protein